MYRLNPADSSVFCRLAQYATDETLTENVKGMLSEVSSEALPLGQILAGIDAPSATPEMCDTAEYLTSWAEHNRQYAQKRVRSVASN